VKKTEDKIVGRMKSLPIVSECYEEWWQLQCEIENYSEQERKLPRLSAQKEFRAIKNTVIQEAENIRMGSRRN